MKSFLASAAVLGCVLAYVAIVPIPPAELTIVPGQTLAARP